MGSNARRTLHFDRSVPLRSRGLYQELVYRLAPAKLAECRHDQMGRAVNLYLALKPRFLAALARRSVALGLEAGLAVDNLVRKAHKLSDVNIFRAYLGPVVHGDGGPPVAIRHNCSSHLACTLRYLVGDVENVL